MTEGESGLEDGKRDPIFELEQELEFIKRTLLKELLRGSQERDGVDEDWLKKVSGYLKVAERVLELVQARKKEMELENSPSVRLVFEVLKEVPALKALLLEPEIKAQVLKRIRARLKEERDAQS